MTLGELMEKLAPVAAENPEMKVLVGREGGGWFDVIGEVRRCRTNRQHDGLICAEDPRGGAEGDGEAEEVLVIDT